jgi:ribulose-phosphate 3-epimerase
VIEQLATGLSRRNKLAELRSAAPVILPSLLLCDFGRLTDEISALEAAGVKALHLDVMDGHFVPNLSYGLPIVEAVRHATELPVDVHLMISEPGKYVRRFVEAGADVVTIHVETAPQPRELLAEIRELGAAAGLALNPGTPVQVIEPALDACDVVLVMSVEPGFGGQAFKPVALEKLRRLRSLAGQNTVLAVDGGVGRENVQACAEAGAEWFVVGSAIFKNADYGRAVAELVALAQ